MAWNKPENKSIQSIDTSAKAAPISVGAPISYSPSLQPKTGYHDGWDITKAYQDGVAKVTWVYRCIDVIASNQAKLPMVFRKDNNPFGEVITEAPLLEIFNNTTNVGENAFAFRYRLSAQLLMSTRGVFIEIVRDKIGNPIALHLLPPADTSPIPDIKKFVKGYEVKLPQGDTRVIKPENVIWIRRPHPLDPYLSMTPMESAGVAIEVENLAKIYNRNFLINDGRPGGLLVLRSEINEEDKDELRSRFQGNIARAGAVGVIASDDGADFVDTAASPRDAAYIQMRTINKEEIFAAFGVPESIIGNSSGRTFSNAMEEGKVFWMETMEPHLDLIARSFDPIDPIYFVDFDVSGVPILILTKQEQQNFYLQEYQQGLISVNEYRTLTDRKKVEAELADSILANPNLTPIANTEKPMEDPNAAAQQQGPMAGAMPGVPGADPMASPQGEVPMGPEGAPMSPEGAPAAPAGPEGASPMNIQAGVPLTEQASQAQQSIATEFSPEEGGFVPLGTVQGTDQIELPADQIPSELEGFELDEEDEEEEIEGRKSLPFLKSV
jgi:HK97 family phage portal protein